MPGPIGKREEERRRRNKDVIETIKINVDELLAGEMVIPKPPEHLDDHNSKCDDDCERHTGEMVGSWHPFAEQAYLSLAASGQVIFMEPSDWATAFVLCEMISRELKPKPILTTSYDDGHESTEIQWVVSPVNGAVMGAFLKGWASLMATEGERRRLKIELDRKKRQEQILSGGNVVSITQSREEALS